MTASQPIGIFDSGIGGLTVTQAIARALPHEDIIYFGDTAHLPYGDKSAKTIQNYALEITKFLLNKNCKMILIACNTASAVAYELIKAFADGKALVINVIDPTIEYLAKHYANKKIGLIATYRTIESQIYSHKITALNINIELAAHATPLLAKAIEDEFANYSIISKLLEEYLSHPALHDIHALILGCTHYPVIKENIKLFFPPNVEIIDSAAYVAAAAKNCLSKNNLLNIAGKGHKHFLVSDYTKVFARRTELFFGKEVILTKHRLSF